MDNSRQQCPTSSMLRCGYCVLPTRMEAISNVPPPPHRRCLCFSSNCQLSTWVARYQLDLEQASGWTRHHTCSSHTLQRGGPCQGKKDGGSNIADDLGPTWSSSNLFPSFLCTPPLFPPLVPSEVFHAVRGYINTSVDSKGVTWPMPVPYAGVCVALYTKHHSGG